MRKEIIICDLCGLRGTEEDIFPIQVPVQYPVGVRTDVLDLCSTCKDDMVVLAIKEGKYYYKDARRK